LFANKKPGDLKLGPGKILSNFEEIPGISNPARGIRKWPGRWIFLQSPSVDSSRSS